MGLSHLSTSKLDLGTVTGISLTTDLGMSSLLVGPIQAKTKTFMPFGTRSEAPVLVGSGYCNKTPHIGLLKK